MEHRRSHLWNVYRLTPQQYEDLLEAQNGVCAICFEEETRKRNGRTLPLHVDHNAKTGVVRALLCHRCNTAIGLFREDPNRIRAAADYLERLNGEAR